MKRVTMGGTDAVVTDDRVAALLLEYATELGRVGSTATVTVPAVLEGRSVEASMLLGPASQITVLPDPDPLDGAVAMLGLEDALAELQGRIDRLAGRASGVDGGSADVGRFSDLDLYED